MGSYLISPLRPKLKKIRQVRDMLIGMIGDMGLMMTTSSWYWTMWVILSRWLPALQMMISVRLSTVRVRLSAVLAPFFVIIYTSFTVSLKVLHT